MTLENSMRPIWRAPNMRRTFLMFAVTGLVTIILALMSLPPIWAATSVSISTTQSTSQGSGPAQVFLSVSSEGAGITISVHGSNFVPDHNITAKFGDLPLSLSGTCITDTHGDFSGCTFIVPSVHPGTYKVMFSDGVSSPYASFTIPSISIPESTFLVTMTSIGLGLVTQLVTKRVVDLDAERRMKAEVNAFNKEKREATLAKDKVKLEKLKKKELPMRQEQAKVSSARLKVTAITFIPLLGVYYLMASFLGGFNVVVAYSPIPIPLLVGTGHIMALFWWYMLSSFTFTSLLTRLLHTTT